MKSQTATIKKFPPITKQRALAIAVRTMQPKTSQIECYSQKPGNWHIYCAFAEQPCWYIRLPHENEQPALGSSHAMVISRMDGKILYAGSAGDEG